MRTGVALAVISWTALCGGAARAGATDPPPATVSQSKEVRLGELRAYRPLDLDWRPGPFPGVEIAVLAGDPKAGMHHSYLRFADGVALAPHWHSSDEYVTVVSGTMLVGFGDTADRAAARLFGPGAFVFVPAGARHYAFAKGRVVISQTRAGPADTHWVHPEDDPARAPAAGADSTRAPAGK